MMRTSFLGGSLSRATALAAIGVLLAAEQVSAALFVVLEPGHGPPGTVVMGRTAGNGALAGTTDPLRTYLVPRAVADEVSTADDPALVAIGELVVDAERNGRTSFIGPRVESGDYVVMAFCAACAPTSAGRTMLPIADFRVTAAAPATDADTGILSMDAFEAFFLGLPWPLGMIITSLFLPAALSTGLGAVVAHRKRHHHLAVALAGAAALAFFLSAAWWEVMIRG